MVSRPPHLFCSNTSVSRLKTWPIRFKRRCKSTL